MDRVFDTDMLEQGKRVAVAEDDFFWEEMRLWPGGDNIRPSERGLVHVHRCHICGQEGGH